MRMSLQVQDLQLQYNHIAVFGTRLNFLLPHPTCTYSYLSLLFPPVFSLSPYQPSEGKAYLQMLASHPFLLI